MTLPDLIEIHELRTRTIIGVHERERREPQEILISLRMFTDTRRPGASDRLEDALDYDAVARKVGAFVESTSYTLVERLAEEIARVCLTEFHLPRIEVRVEKPSALSQARSVSVTIQRSGGEP